MAEHRKMRASDADRAQIADHLRRATAEGRLLAHEFDDRLGQALHARTYGELDAIVADLPRGRAPAERPGPAGALLRPHPALIAMTTAAVAAIAVVVLLASLTATGVRIPRPPVRPPLASIPTGSASPRPVHVVLNAPGPSTRVSPATVVVNSSPPRGAG